MKLSELYNMPVRLNERIATDRKAKTTGYYTYKKYYELLRELFFKSEDIISGKNENKARFAHRAIEYVLNEFDEDTKKHGHTPSRRLGRRYLAKRCKEFERLINAKI